MDSTTQNRVVSNTPRPATTATVAPANAPSGITFAQSTAAPVPGSDGSSFVTVERYRCSSHGHFENNCPSTPVQSGLTLTQYASVMAQAAFSAIDPQWILLDSEAAECNSSCNTQMQTLSAYLDSA